MKLDDISPGHQFGPYRFAISDTQAKSYAAATGPDDQKDVADPFQAAVHPLQIDAFVLKNLIAELGIIQDRIETIHAGQQMTVHRTVSPREQISAATTLKSNALRRGSRWATFATTYRDSEDAVIAESASTIILLPDQ